MGPTTIELLIQEAKDYEMHIEFQRECLEQAIRVVADIEGELARSTAHLEQLRVLLRGG